MSENQNIKRRAFSSMLWKFAERVCAQLVSLVVTIVLARILLPEDYSVVSIVTIFFTFCNVFITGGLNTALIQKKDADRLDYSTVLHVSMIASALLYVLVYAFAPTIARIYDLPLLTPVFRVMGLTFFINAYKAVLCAYISSNLQFRTFFYATIIGTAISAVVGVAMALKGFGAWALVAQQMSNSLIDTLILALVTRLKLQWKISFERLRGLFSYGWKIFVSSIIGAIFDEIKPLIIGVKFSGEDLAYYNRGKSFPSLLNSTLSETLSAVLFPVLAKYQDDKDAILAMTRRYMRVASYLVMPLLLGFLATAESFVRVLLTDKWLPAVPYIQIFCIAHVFNIIQTGNLQAIRAIGRSDILLILEIIKKSSYCVIIILAVWLSDSPEWIAMTGIITSLLASLINAFPNRRLIGYGYRMQIVDLGGNLLSALLMAALVYSMNRLPLPMLPLLLLQIAVGVLAYILISLVTKNENLHYCISLLQSWKGGKSSC